MADKFLKTLKLPGIDEPYKIPQTAADVGARPVDWMPTAEDVGAISMELLWENASPTSAFAAQTVSIDLADFGAVDIEYRTTNQSGSRVVKRVYMDRQGILGEVINVTGGGVYASAVMRTAKVSETGVQFAAGFEKLVSNTDTREDNARVVPTRIFGVKGVKQ